MLGPAAFDAVSARISEALGDLAIRIEHVGSTSVPGLAAKPIIDVGVSVGALIPRAPIVERLEAIGFTFQVDPTTPEHLYFKMNEGDVRKVQVHVSEAGSDWERRHLAFRDWLRTHPEDAAAYVDLKRRLASLHPNDVFTYTESKGPFIEATLDRSSTAPRS